MNNIQIFNNSEFGEVRTALIDNKPMFCLVDVCRVLEIKNPSDCKSRLKEPGVAITEVGVVTGTKKDGTESIQQVLMTFIDESNLYKVIFQSRKPQAEQFTDWVTSEVLPTIRKTGLYSMPSGNDLIALAIIEAKKLIEEKDKKITELTPKALFADAVSASHTTILIGELAKLLKQNGVDIGQNRLFEKLRNEGFLVKNGSSKNIPTQKAMQLGLFEIKEGSYIDSQGNNVVTRTVKVTGKGQVYFVNRYLRNVTELPIIQQA